MKQPPHNLSEITLSQWVGYQNMYGQDLENRFEQMKKLPLGQDRTNEYLIYDVDLHLYYYSYFTGTPMEEVRKIPVSTLIKMQGAAFIAHKKQHLTLNYNRTFQWNNQTWKIQPIGNIGDQLTEEQYEHVTDLALVWSDLQDGKHEALYELCGIHLRHPDEPYSTELLYQRKKLMEELPLDIALCVRQYTIDSINKYLKIVKRS